jgi:hypothetical protein
VSATERLADALAALPTEPHEIARVFAELGIKGRPASAYECPVANYLTAELGIIVEVGQKGAYAGVTEVPLPEHVRRFVRVFDLGAYPRLIARHD